MKKLSLLGQHRLTAGTVWSIVPWMLAIPVALSMIRPVWENDLFLHILMGKDILANHRLTGDPNWLYGASDSKWVTTMAISEVLMYLLYSGVGFIGFTILQMLAGIILVAIVFSCLGSLAPKPVNPVATRIGTLLGSVITIFYSSSILPRPQVISVLLFPLVAVWIIKIATQAKYPPALPAIALVMVWTWFHGYSLLVAPLFALATLIYVSSAYIVDREEGRLAYRDVKAHIPLVLLLFVVPIVNPIGYKYWISSVNIGRASSKFISEWLPPKLSDDTLIVIVLLFLTWALYAGRQLYQLKSKRVLPQISKPLRLTIIREAMLALSCLVILIQSHRTSLLLLPILGFILAKRLMIIFDGSKVFDWETLPNTFSKSKTYILATLLIITVLTISLANTPKAWRFADSTIVPVKLYEKMGKVSGEHRVIMTYNISSTLIPFLPNAKVAVDGRTDKYGRDGSLRLLGCIRYGEECEKVLREYPGSTDAILRDSDALAGILVKQGWRVRGESIIDSKSKYIWLSNNG